MRAFPREEARRAVALRAEPYECFSGVGCQDSHNVKQSHLARVSQEKVPRRESYPLELKTIERNADDVAGESRSPR
jgi:hypothetical protein